MTTTTQITNIDRLLDLSGYVNDFVDDYDMGAVRRDYVQAIEDDVPNGITICFNGDVIAELEVAETARDIDWEEITDRIDIDEILERHERKATER